MKNGDEKKMLCLEAVIIIRFRMCTLKRIGSKRLEFLHGTSLFPQNFFLGVKCVPNGMQFSGHLHIHTTRLKTVVAPRLCFFRWALGVRVFPSQQSSIQMSLLNCPA